MEAMLRQTLLGTSAALTALALAGGTGSAEVLRYSSITEERLQNPEPQNWLMYRGNYAGWGYSPLDQINTSNVKTLEPIWSVSTGVVEGHQSPPIVNDGVMFVTTPQAQVLALDAKTGEVLWRYKRDLPEDLTQLHPTNRGVALWGDTVFVATVDCFLVALDAKNGQVRWETPVDDYRKGYYMTLAPLVAKGRVMVGVSGGEYGIRGYVAAYDVNGAQDQNAPMAAARPQAANTESSTQMTPAQTGAAAAGIPAAAEKPNVPGSDQQGSSQGQQGKTGGAGTQTAAAETGPRGGRQLWRTYTIPAPGEPGNESWPGDTWQHGGGSIWIQGSYDPKTGLSYWGTGNASPWMPDLRPGDNLYANSVIALDVETGKMKGYHQYHQNEAWDWDEVSTPILVDLPGKDGNGTVPGLVHAGRNGYLWELERTQTGAINFISGQPFVRQNVFAKIDPQTGRPTYDPSKVPGIGKRADFCPSLWGGKDWPPEAYNPKTGYLYIPANENLCGYLSGTKQEYVAGQWYAGVALTDIGMTVYPGADYIGEVQAWDLKTGKKVWTHNFEKSQNWGPMLTTGGNLAFSGGTNDRKFRAFDAKTGDVLWEFTTNSGVTGVPSSYMIDGVQYIAVQSGWGVDAQRKQVLLGKLLGYNVNVPQGGVVWVFALRK